MSARDIVEHPFLAVEPEVVILNNDNKTHLTMQVVFKGIDRLSVKFEFNGMRLISLTNLTKMNF
jgi:hypothetical protein